MVAGDPRRISGFPLLEVEEWGLWPPCVIGQGKATRSDQTRRRERAANTKLSLGYDPVMCNVPMAPTAHLQLPASNSCTHMP